MSAAPGPPPLRTAIIIDYQNVHLVGHEAFPSTRYLERHESLVDTLLFALELLNDIDLVILASHDSDLEPAIDEGRDLGTAKIESFRWDSPDAFAYQLRSGDRTRPIWCTRLDEVAFRASRDLTPY